MKYKPSNQQLYSALIHSSSLTLLRLLLRPTALLKATTPMGKALDPESAFDRLILSSFFSNPDPFQFPCSRRDFHRCDLSICRSF
ncbi:hypothetical protein M5K25_023386 [Dendrobium thyrsiflorum]|uniref:Uncharacterized protein n=1 Tax=Dendrobium thyrsiflorum TaxID=117978 RepID=A0ABD0U877_DENTH